MFSVRVAVAEGVCFPYFVMGKAQLRITPFCDPWVWADSIGDPFERFAAQYGAAMAQLGCSGELWYDWLAFVVDSCPYSTTQALAVCPATIRPVAAASVPQFAYIWPRLEALLTKQCKAAISDTDLRQVIRANEELFGMEYPPDGKQLFFVSFFPTLAAQQPGSHFVLGSACLDDPSSLRRTIAAELGITLLWQLIESDEIAAVLPIVERLTRHDRDVQGRGALLEAVNQIVRSCRSGSDVDVARLRKPEAEGYWCLLQALYEHRDLMATGLPAFVSQSVKALKV